MGANTKSLPNKISLVKDCRRGRKKRCIRRYKRDGRNLTVRRKKMSKISELWYKRDRSYLVAKTNLFIKFSFEKDVNDVKFASQLRLFIYAINNVLRNYFFQESLRQNSFVISANPNGFTVKIMAF